MIITQKNPLKVTFTANVVRKKETLTQCSMKRLFK